MDPIGVVVRVPSTNYFIFRTFIGVEAEGGSLLVAGSDEQVLAKVVAVRRRNAVVDPRLVAQLDDVESVKYIKENLGAESLLYYTEAKAVVVGALRGGRLRRPSKPLRPLDYVYRAPPELVAEFLAPRGEGPYIELGTVWGYDIPASVDATRLVTQHCAILASTGAGKSWLAGVIIERLVDAAEVSVVVFDPHGEYSAMQVARSEAGKSVADLVDVYVVGKVDVSAQDKAFEARFGVARRYERVALNPRSLPLRVLERILEGTYGLTDAQRRILEEGWQAATAYGDRQPLTDLEQLIEEVLEGGKAAAPGGYAGEMALGGLAGRLRALFKGSPIFLERYGETFNGEPVRLFEPARLLTSRGIKVLDLSGLDLFDQRIFVAVALDGMYKAALRRANIPTLVVVEEAHNFVPARESPVSKPYAVKIAREGRKFGLGLCLISQRPTKLDPDALSQCMTQIFKRIINPVDLKYVAAVAEHLDDPYQLRGLDEEAALVTGVSVSLPLLVKVGERWTQHGGVGARLTPRA
ncbi:MAG: ATP-binding protein [Thermoproteus sp.]